MFSRSHRSRNSKAQGFANDQQGRKTPDSSRSLLAELGLVSSGSSTPRFGRSARRTDLDRPPAYDYASSIASARSYGVPSYPEKSKFRFYALPSWAASS
jgi:hypothetical protein